MEFKIDNVCVYGLNESIGASGYPKSVTPSLDIITEKDIKRVGVLGHARPGSGHDCFLKGVIVQWDITATHAFWIQYLRYHFSDIISSQSKMHKIIEMNFFEQCHDLTDKDVIDRCIELKRVYLNSKTVENFERLIYSLPMGLMLTARCTDNYLSIKTQYIQRKTDKLTEWHLYCEAVEALPEFELLIGEKHE